MPIRRRGNKLERWEISLIKATIADGRWPNDQDILAHFTRPTRSINHRAIAEIRTGKKHTAAKATTADELDNFLASWPEVDAETGLSLRSFRRQAKLIKALELLSARMPVSRISDRLGFGEPSAFIAMFRAAYGVTPGRYLTQD